MKREGEFDVTINQPAATLRRASNPPEPAQPCDCGMTAGHYPGCKVAAAASVRKPRDRPELPDCTWPQRVGGGHDYGCPQNPHSPCNPPPLAGTRAWVAEHMEKRLWPKLVALRKAGQQEYAGGERAFGNFERLAARTGASRETVLWIYLAKHLDGIEAWLKGHKSQREPVQGRIEDAIVYLILLHAMAEEELAALPVAQPAALPANGEEA